MDFESLKSYANSIFKNATEGPDLFFCRPYLEGPDFSYPQITDVSLNFVFCEVNSGWLFITNAHSRLSVGSPVSIYCSSTVTLQQTFSALKRVIRHFFLFC